MSKTLASFVGLLALLLSATVSTRVKADSDFKVTLLGTGTPIPDPDRFGPSTLVEAGRDRSGADIHWLSLGHSAKYSLHDAKTRKLEKLPPTTH